MAIEIICDKCGNKYLVADDKAGSKVKCRECGARIPVVAEDDEGEIFDTGISNRTRSTKRRGSPSTGAPKGLLIGIGAVTAVVVFAVVLFAMSGRGRNNEQVAQAQTPPNGPNPVSAPPAPGTPIQTSTPPVQNNTLPVAGLPSSPQTPPANALPNTAVAGNLPSTPLPSSPPAAALPDSANQGAPPVAVRSGFTGGDVAPGAAPAKKKFGGFANAGSAGDGADAATPPAHWEVKVDPPTVNTKIDATKPISLKFPQGASHADLLFPASPSVFVALGANSSFSPTREIWNLATKSKLGVVTTDKANGWNVSALSPDGQHLAIGHSSGADHKVTVWICKSGKSLGELDVTAPITNLLFAGAGRLVAVSRDGSARVWKIPSGDLEHELTVGMGKEPNAVAVSPGGNYLAAVASKSALKLFDLNTGTVTGEIALPYESVFFANSADAMSFSPDGAELALVMPIGVHEKEFSLYQMSDGKRLTKVELNVKNIWGTPDRLKSNRLEWFPDRSKLLWRGHHVLDARTGGPVWSAPEDDSSDAPRKILGDDRILIAVGGRQNPSLKVAPVPLAEISAAAKLVAEGGEASDAGMPALTKSDTAGYRPIAASAVATWSMKADPTAPGRPAKNSIRLPRERGHLGGAFISRPDIGRAVVWFTDEIGSLQQSGGLHRHVQGQHGTIIDILDLTTGQPTGSLPMAYSAAIVDVSPDAEAVAIKTIKPNDERIDVYHLPDGKLLAGWRPFQQKEDFFKGVTNTVLMDSQYCLTQNFKGTAYLWKLPECHAVWRLEAGSNFCRSPGGKYLGFQAETRYLFMEARTGELVAELPLTMPTIKCAFHPMGTHLAILGSDGVSHKVMIVDVATGKPTYDFFSAEGDSSIQWCGDADLLLDGKWLIDLKQQKNGWQYNLTYGAPARTQPDGRHWFVVGANALDQNLFLSGIDLPEKVVADKLNSVQIPSKALLAPGMQMNLDVKLTTTPTNHSNLAMEVGTHFRTGLEKNGFYVGMGGPYTLTVTVTQSNVGKNLELRMAGRPGVISVPELKVDCEVALLSGGQAVWKTTRTIANDDFYRISIPNGVDVATHLTNNMWQRVADHLKSFPVPIQLFGQDAAAGLGQSTLVPGGTQPMAR